MKNILTTIVFAIFQVIEWISLFVFLPLMLLPMFLAWVAFGILSVFFSPMFLIPIVIIHIVVFSRISRGFF